MKKFHLTLSPELKDLFQEKLDKDQITATAFVKYYIYELINERVDQSILDKIRIYQETNPGTQADLSRYVMINLDDEEHRKFFMNKLTLNIYPQHYLRFFVEAYCKEGLPEKIIRKMKEFILKRGPKMKRKQ